MPLACKNIEESQSPAPNECFFRVIYGSKLDTGESSFPPDQNYCEKVELDLMNGATKMNVEPVYGKDGITKKYNKCTLSIESIIYRENLTQIVDDSLNPNPNQQPNPLWGRKNNFGDPTERDATHPKTSIEHTVAAIRRTLTTPGLKLACAPIGLGMYPLINGDSDDVDYMLARTGVTFQPIDDDALGPIPQSLDIEPFASNNAIRIQWTVVFHIRDCQQVDDDGNPITPTTLIEYTSESDWQVDEEGDLTFSFIGDITMTKSSAFGIDPLYLADLGQTLKHIEGFLFEGMKATSRITKSRDNRNVRFTITWTTIKSVNALWPQANDIRATDTISSNLMRDGFKIWKRVINVDVKLWRRLKKDQAYYIFYKILGSRFRYLFQTERNLDQDDRVRKKDEIEELQGEKDAWYVPMALKVTDDIYSRRVRFSSEYMIVNDLTNIINVTRVIARVNTEFTGQPENSVPKTASDQWLSWHLASFDLKTNEEIERWNERSSLDYYATNAKLNVCVDPAAFIGVFERPEVYGQEQLKSPQPLNEYEIDPDQSRTDCGKVVPANPPDPTVIPYGADATLLAYPSEIYCPSNPNAGKTGYTYDEQVKTRGYISWDTDFQVVEDVKSIPVNFLEDINPMYYNTTPTDYQMIESTTRPRESINFAINSKTTADDTNAPTDNLREGIMVARGTPRFYIRMVGRASRIANPIPMPVIVQFGNRPVYRVGTPLYTQRISAQGETSVYTASWDITYAVIDDMHVNDILGNLKSTASQSVFL